MATNLNIDNDLLNKALALSGCKTKKETVNTALREFVQRREKEKVISLFGTIEYDKDYNYKNERKKKSLGRYFYL